VFLSDAVKAWEKVRNRREGRGGNLES